MNLAAYRFRVVVAPIEVPTFFGGRSLEPGRVVYRQDQVLATHGDALRAIEPGETLFRATREVFAAGRTIRVEPGELAVEAHPAVAERPDWFDRMVVT